jgi:ATP-dependent Clp protease adapter protein ClpS|tara:strand:+ start:304 stop:606 length:303 start_codon:yes stop_codon:yes gene_type:complete
MSDVNIVAVREILDISAPKDCKVIYLNDNETSFEFVQGSLMQYFDYEETSAKDKTLEIHDAGSSVVAVLPFEIAEQRGVEVLVSARHNGFPTFEIKLEQE